MRWLQSPARSRPFLLFLIILCSGCFLPVRRESPSQATTPEAFDLFNRAEKARSLGKLEEAALLYDSYSQSYPDTDLSDDALFRSAQVHEELGFSDRAIEKYRNLLQKYSQSEWNIEARLSLGRLLSDLGRQGEAIDVLKQLVGRSLTRGEQLEISAWLGHAYEELGALLSATRWFGKAWELETNPEIKNEIEKKVSSWIAERLTFEELQGVIQSFPRSYPGTEARYQLAVWQMREGKLSDATSELEEIVRWEFNEERKARAYLLLNRLDVQKEIGERRIGALLPLTGKYAGYGTQVLEGMELSIGLFGAQRSSISGLNVLLYDTQGDPERARRGVEWLISKGVVAIVGPITTAEAETAAPVAQKAEIPLFSFAQRTGDDLQYFFRLNPTHFEQVKKLVQYAIEGSSLHRFALLYPDDPYGHEWASLVRQEVEQQGGTMVAAEFYGLSSDSISEAIQRLIGVPVGSKPQSHREGKEEKQKVEIPFEVLFIPDYYKNVARVVPQLAYHDVRGAQILGTSAWNSPDLLEFTGRSLEGAVFPALFFLDSPIPSMREFEKKFTNTFWEVPDSLSALAYDIMTQLDSVLIRKEIASGYQLRQVLVEGKRFQGVTGESFFLPNGEIVKEMTLVRIERGRMIPILH